MIGRKLGDLLVGSSVLVFSLLFGTNDCFAQRADLGESGSSKRVRYRVTPSMVEAAFHRQDISFEKKRGDDGDPIYLFKLADFKVQIFFYGKDEDGWRSIQFHAGFKGDDSTSLKQINEWNRTKRFGRAYLDSEGDPHIEYDLDFEGGVSETVIDEGLKTFRALLIAFALFLQ